MNKYLRWHFFYRLFLITFFVSCQNALVPQAKLTPETDIKLSSAVPADENTETFIAPYRQQLKDRMNQVLGQSVQEIKKGNGVGESELGNFVADAQLVQAEKLYQKPIDLSLITTGSLRAPIPAGPVTLGHIFELLPFENQMLVLTLSGVTLQKMFDHGARVNNLALSNAGFSILDKKPADILIKGKPLQVNQQYTVVASDYLANGGDHLSFLKEAIRVDTLGILHRDLLIKHIQELTAQNKSISARLEGRIK